MYNKSKSLVSVLLNNKICIHTDVSVINVKEWLFHEKGINYNLLGNLISKTMRQIYYDIIY